MEKRKMDAGIAFDAQQFDSRNEFSPRNGPDRVRDDFLLNPKRIWSPFA